MSILESIRQLHDDILRAFVETRGARTETAEKLEDTAETLSELRRAAELSEYGNVHMLPPRASEKGREAR